MSLERLVLRDFVIVPHLELEFTSGFTALTGETGAGKSILIDALQMVLGERASTAWIRDNALRCEVSAVFSLNPSIHNWLVQAGFTSESEQEREVLVRRQVDHEGKSKGWINSSPCTATQLRQLGGFLLDIHGQHAWQSLMEPASVRGLLDAYAGYDSTALLQAWQRWQNAIAQHAQAQLQADTHAQHKAQLQWQLEEMEKLSPQPNEWETLNQEHQRLAHAQSLLDAANTALQALDTDGAGVQHGLHTATQALQNLQHIEPRFEGWTLALAEAQNTVQDCVRQLHNYLHRTEVDPDTLQRLDNRMGMWVGVARKFKIAPENMHSQWQTWQQAYEAMEQMGDLVKLEAVVQEAKNAFMHEAKIQSVARAKAAPKLAGAITEAMQTLGMHGGRFEVHLPPLSQPSSYGLEGVEFLVAAHEGASAKGVSKVASGGELSRLALAIAVTTSQLGQVSTLIFDEIDSGIGGGVANTVGRLMKQLGHDKQVLAVTHLPQVAACANHHLKVIKTTHDGKTTSQVISIEGPARTEEIARMLGGQTLSPTTLAHAKEMLNDNG